MNEFGVFGDVHVSLADDHVALAEIQRPPNNFFDRALIEQLCDAFEALDAEDGCRAIVLASEGRHFCAGANFGGGGGGAAARGKWEERGPPTTRGETSTTRRCVVLDATPGGGGDPGRGHRRRPRPRADARLPGRAPEARFSANSAAAASTTASAFR